MAKDKLIIKRVFLARSTRNFGYSSKILAEFQTVGEVTGVLVPEYQQVIDIETGEVFPAVIRDESGRIKNFDIENLCGHEIIALHFLDKEWDKMGLLQEILLKSKAKKVYYSYLRQKENKKEGPVLSKTKESREKR